MKKSLCLFPLLLTGLAFFFCTGPSDSTEKKSPDYNMSALHTSGRLILNDQDEPVLLKGVNIPGLEWDSYEPHVQNSFTVAVDEWGCNLIRLPLNQDRWYGYGAEQNDKGARYRKLVDDLVAFSLERKIYIWLDLHWSNGGEWGRTIGQHVMPDSLSLVFWKDVAKRYKNHPAVLFGLYNEPYGVSWDIWKNGGMLTEDYDRGGETAELTYRAAGHQELVNAIRAQGADNPIIAAGLDWGFDLSGILNGYALDGDNIIYDTHPYPWKPENWDKYWVNTGETYPVIVGEWGDTEENQNYFFRILRTMRDHEFSWTAWCFHADAGPQMLADWSYTPTYFGAIVKMELAAAE